MGEAECISNTVLDSCFLVNVMSGFTLSVKDECFSKLSLLYKYDVNASKSLFTQLLPCKVPGTLARTFSVYASTLIFIAISVDYSKRQKKHGDFEEVAPDTLNISTGTKSQLDGKMEVNLGDICMIRESIIRAFPPTIFLPRFCYSLLGQRLPRGRHWKV